MHVEVSPTGKSYACFTASGLLWVTNSDFTQTMMEFDTKSKVSPKQVAWCGNDSLVLHWEKMLFLFGPQADILLRIFLLFSLSVCSANKDGV